MVVGGAFPVPATARGVPRVIGGEWGGLKPPAWENRGVQQRLPSLRVPPIGFAHRGARAHAPENTIEGFRLALRLGATGLESDVWITEDGEAVLDHDGVVRGRFSVRKAIREVPRAALPGHIPTLAELYDACGTDFELSLDLKDDDAVDAGAQRREGGTP